MYKKSAMKVPFKS